MKTLLTIDANEMQTPAEPCHPKRCEERKVAITMSVIWCWHEHNVTSYLSCVHVELLDAKARIVVDELNVNQITEFNEYFREVLAKLCS
jgi:hypothetical protein